MIEFYSPDIESALELPESDSAHCVRVLRMRSGDELTVVDGKGTRYKCLLLDAHPKHASVQILERLPVAKSWNFELTLAVAPTKHNDRMEWLLEKAVEIGVDRVVLFRSERSERKAINLERMEKVMVSAMKQSLKATLPALEGLVPFRDFISEGSLEGFRCFGYCDARFPKTDFTQRCPARVPVTIMIGPEGDFTPAEVQAAVEAGFVPVTFGENRLRTETAALFGVAATHVINQLKQ